MTLLINDKEVRKLLDFDELLEDLRDAYEQCGNGQVVNPVRRGMRTDRIEAGEHPHDDSAYRGIGMNFAYSDKYKLAAVKILTVFDGMKILTHLIDTAKGRTLAIFNSTWESYVRAGGDGAVGTRLLAREDVKVLGLVGTGICGRLLLDFHLRVRDFNQVYCHSGRRPDEGFAREMGRKTGMDIVAAKSVQEVVERADVIVSSTRATSPIIKAEWIRPGVHITGIGADTPFKSEYEPEVFKKIDKLVIDYDLVFETLQIREALKTGALSRKGIHADIGEIAAGKKPGRESDSEVSAYISTGMTIGYVMILKRIYDKALQEGIGIKARRADVPAPILGYLFLANE